MTGCICSSCNDTKLDRTPKEVWGQEPDRWAAILGHAKSYEEKKLKGKAKLLLIENFQQELLDTIEKYRIPIWPWQRLAAAMKYDLTHDGFASFLTFLRYSEGAAISPASIFMHLCGVRKTGDKYDTPGYDIRLAARSLAIFSYLVHILRDFEKDHKSGLNYFADNLLRKFELNRETLSKIAQGEPATPEFRLLMNTYHRFAQYYRQKARRCIDSVLPHLEPRYQLSR